MSATHKSRIAQHWRVYKHFARQSGPTSYAATQHACEVKKTNDFQASIRYLMSRGAIVNTGHGQYKAAKVYASLGDMDGNIEATKTPAKSDGSNEWVSVEIIVSVPNQASLTLTKDEATFLYDQLSEILAK